MHPLRRRVLTTLALDRTPGFTFAGNYLGVRFVDTSPQQARVQIDAGEHCEDETGSVDWGAVCLLADVAMATAVRARLAPEQRLATVSMHLQFNGEALRGALEGIGECPHFVAGADSRQGLCRVVMHADGQPVMFGTGAFMVMDPPPGRSMYPLQSAVHATATPLAIDALDDRERAILARADEILDGAAASRGFLRRFWGFDATPTLTGAACSVVNGPHLANRVGYLQGGLQMGLALETATVALSPDWALSAISSCFLSQGQGTGFTAEARIERRGRNTALVRTVVSDDGGRPVLTSDTTHLRRGVDTPQR